MVNIKHFPSFQVFEQTLTTGKKINIYSENRFFLEFIKISRVLDYFTRYFMVLRTVCLCLFIIHYDYFWIPFLFRQMLTS